MKPSNEEVLKAFLSGGPGSVIGWLLFSGIISYYIVIAVDLAIQLNITSLLCGLFVILPIGFLAYLSKWWSALLLIPVIWLMGIPMYIACDAGVSGHFGLLHLSHEFWWIPMFFAGGQVIFGFTRREPT